MTSGGPRDDRPVALAVAFGFALALGSGTVAIPLLALGAGYDVPAIGLLVAVAAGSQLLMRLALPALLGRFPDRLLVAAAALLMAGSFGLLAISTLLPLFVVAQAGQGASRALFWTASQTHALRSGGSPVRRLVDLNLAGNAGTLSGPVLAGVLATAAGIHAALVAVIVAASLALVGTWWMAVFPAYDRRASGGALRLLRREGVDMACWANLVGGVWWSMVGSYVPVILVGASLGPALIGLLVTLSEAAGAGMLLVLRRTPVRHVPRIVKAGAFAEMTALAAIALAPPVFGFYAALLIAGGAAAGCVTGLAPALVALAAGDQEQGDALALSGLFRSFALLGAPSIVSAVLVLVALPVAIVGIAAAAALPGAVLALRAAEPGATAAA
jgi:hypothetical protein